MAAKRKISFLPFTVLYLTAFPAFANSDSLKKDSSESKKDPFIESGTLSAGYQYGLIPAYHYDKYPTGGYISEGQFALNALSLPVNVSYFYSNLKNAYGINNYFKVSFDANRFKQKMQKKKFSKKEFLDGKIDSLKLAKQKYLQKAQYYKSLEKDYYSDLPKIGGIKIPELNTDSLNAPKFNDSLKIKQPNLSYTQQQDSLREVVALAKHYIDEAEKAEALIKKYQNEIKLLESLKSNQPIHEKTPKAEDFLGKIKTFEIGLCNPSFSTFLINNIPLRGVQTEIESNNTYIAFAHGKVVNNIFLNPNPIQNSLINTQNLFNFFDFGNVKTGRKVTAIKGGLGKKEQSHLYGGLLYGLGYEKYSDSLPISANAPKENNWVLEVDGKLQFLKNHDIQIIGAHSAIQNSIPIGNPVIPNQLLDLKYRSRALLAKSTSFFPSTGTRVILTCRYVEPYFKSFGIGFMRSGHIRYEIRLEQNIGKRVKVAVFYRKDRDNLFHLLQYTNIIYQAGADVRWKVSRSLIFRGNYTPVIQHIVGPGYENRPYNKNFITVASLTHLVSKRKVKMTNSLSASQYNMNDTLGKLQSYKNASFNSNTEFGLFTITNTASWFDFGNSPVLNGQSIIAGSDIGIKIRKRALLIVGAKYSYTTHKKEQWGWKTKLTYNIGRNLSVEGEIEKPVLGEFFLNYDLVDINIFPYFVAVKIITHIGGK